MLRYARTRVFKVWLRHFTRAPASVRCLGTAVPRTCAPVLCAGKGRPRSRPPSAPLRFGSRATSLSFAQGSSRALTRPCASFRLWRCASSCRPRLSALCPLWCYGTHAVHIHSLRPSAPRGSPTASPPPCLSALVLPRGGLLVGFAVSRMCAVAPPSRYRGYKGKKRRFATNHPQPATFGGSAFSGRRRKGLLARHSTTRRKGQDKRKSALAPRGAR